MNEGGKVAQHRRWEKKPILSIFDTRSFLSFFGSGSVFALEIINNNCTN